MGNRHPASPLVQYRVAWNQPKPPVPYLRQVSGNPAHRLLILFTVVFVSDYNLAYTTI